MIPKGWFVKDFADGWIFFDTEEDALRQVDATGAMMLVGISPHDFPTKKGDTLNPTTAPRASK